ncbi:MAG TPA: hypothetical protein DD641_09710 [Deltaproteobacteria bacterium]|nr:hypothetical protein [Deltaproteobacteria bacterium]
MNKETFTISQFCEAHNMSRAFFYILKKKGQAPKVVELGGKRLITREEAAIWRAGLDNLIEEVNRAAR